MERRDLDPFAELKGTKDEYNVYDAHYEKVGKVDDLIVDENDRVLYVGVKMGFLGTNSTIVPAETVRVNDRRRLIEVSEPAETIKRAPHFGSGDELTPELENHVRSYFGLEALRPTSEHDPQGSYVPGDAFAPNPRVDIVQGERAEIQEFLAPEPGGPVDVPLGNAPEPTTSRGSEALPRESRDSGRPDRGLEGRWERERTESGVTIHRLRS